MRSIHSLDARRGTAVSIWGIPGDETEAVDGILGDEEDLDDLE